MTNAPPTESAADPFFIGRRIRTARKAGRCGDRCGRMINSGDKYVEGDVDPYKAGGFAFDRICLICAGLTPAPPSPTERAATYLARMDAAIAAHVDKPWRVLRVRQLREYVAEEQRWGAHDPEGYFARWLDLWTPAIDGELHLLELADRLDRKAA